MAAIALLLTLAADVSVRLTSGVYQAAPKIAKLNIEEYVAGVLEGEATVMRSDESLKAMAIAARTYAERFRGRHAAQGFDFCETTHCQDYRAPVSDRMAAAAEWTEGELLYVRGRLAETLYSKHCGGRIDSDCPRFPWRREILRRDAPGPVEQLVRDPASRDRLQLALRLPSPFFELSPFPDRYVFTGWGEGHGRGLCQHGCARMGEAGATYRQILDRYYPGSTVSGGWIRMPGERVDVFMHQPDGALSQAADRALRQAEALSFPLAGVRPRLHAYATVAQFRNATGEAGSVAAVTRGIGIRIQPPELLRARGVLEPTLRHEMLHVILESRSAPGQPWWFREGLVLCLNSETPADPAYRDAAARVRQLIRDHGRGAVLGWWQRGLPRQIPPGGAHQRPGQAEAKHKAQ